MKKSIIASFILSLFLLSCSVYNQTTEPVIGTPQQQTSTAIQLIVPTSTQAVNTSIALPTLVKSPQHPTSTPTSSAPIPNVVEQCPKILDSSPDPSNLPAGSLVLLNSAGKGQDSVIYNIKTGQKTQLPLLGRAYIGRDIAISPHNQWIAYIVSDRTSGSILIISDPNGKVIKEIAIKSLKPLEKTLQARFGTYLLEEWLNNEQLLIGYGTGVATADTPAGSRTFDSHTLVLNPFTGQQTTLNSDFPGHDHDIGYPGSWSTFAFTRAVYDPNLQYVVYPSFIDVILWDLQNAKEIARFPEFRSFSYSHPIWSKDGKSFLIELPDGGTPTSARYLYQVDRAGKLHQLTPFIQTGFKVILNYSWSPDEKSVAFWMNINADQYELGVVNLVNGKVINLCIPGDFDPDYPVHNSPIWSPDSQYLAVHSRLNQEQENGEVFIIDLNKKGAYPLPEISLPVGWVTP